MHHLDVPLQVRFGHVVLSWVQGSRGCWQLRGIAGKAPKASRLARGTRVVDNGGQGLPNIIERPINVIMGSSSASPSSPYGAVGLRRHDCAELMSSLLGAQAERIEFDWSQIISQGIDQISDSFQKIALQPP